MQTTNDHRGMAPPPKGRVHDPERLAALAATGLLDTEAEESFDRLTRIAARVLGVPVSLVSLVAGDRQFFKSSLGLAEPFATTRQTPLSHSFCQHVVQSDAPLVVNNAHEHPLVRDNPAIAELGVVAYAGSPLRATSGLVLGSVCAIDSRPRQWSDEDLRVLDDLARVVSAEVELREVGRKLRESQAEMRLLLDLSERFAASDDLATAYTAALERLCDAAGWPLAEVWVPTAGGGSLERASVWCTAGDESRLAAFARSRRSRLFARGEDLPGRAWAEGEPVRGATGNAGIADSLALPFRTAAGEALGVLAFHSSAPHPRPGGHAGLLAHAAAHLAEMVARKATEGALRESERRFRGTLETVRAPAVALDVDGAVTFANAHFLALTGWQADEVIGQDWFARFVDDGEQLRASFRESVPAHNEDDVLTRDGGRCRIEWDNTVLLDAEGNPVGIAGIGRDVTERRRLEQLKDELIALVSHELRSPLTAIRGAVQLLRSRGVGLGPQETRLLEVAGRNTERLLRLVNDLLDIERIEANQAPLDRRPWPAQTLLDDAVESLGPMGSTAGVELVAERVAPDLAVVADDARVAQVLTNLVGNAIKFSPPGGTVSVGAEAAAENQVCFSVRDEGRGIPADKLESIFGRFEQVEASDAREKGGAGLGLAIARAIVVQHGGRIWAESEPGQGSTFRFTLPA